MQMLLELRGENKATMKDVVGFQKSSNLSYKRLRDDLIAWSYRCPAQKEEEPFWMHRAMLLEELMRVQHCLDRFTKILPTLACLRYAGLEAVFAGSDCAKSRA